MLTPSPIPVVHTWPLPRAIQFNAVQNPELPFWLLQNSKKPGEMTTITHRDFYHAVLRAVQALFPEQSVTKERKVVGILVLSDSIVYSSVLAACFHAGVIPFPIFPRISTEGILNLLKVSNCHHVITTQTTLKSVLDRVVQLDPSWTIHFQEMLTVHETYPSLLQDSTPGEDIPVPDVPLFEHSPDDLFMYAHSSGSTGLPKAVPIQLKVFQTWTNTPFLDDFEAITPRPILCAAHLPNGHFMHFLSHIMAPIFAHVVTVVFPPAVKTKDLLPIAPTTTNILEHTRMSGANRLFTVPAFLSTWSEDPKAVQLLRKLDSVYFGGGPVPPEVGHRLVAAGVHIHSVMGATEMGHMTCHGSDEWQYMAMNRKADIHWEPQGDGTFELQVRNSATYLPAVNNIADPPAYASSDLWEKHPTKDVWRLIGRVDDVILHSSGEKTVPGPLELIITSTPLVKGAIMFGQSHDQAGLLVEPGEPVDANDPQAVEEYRNLIWPFIEKANEKAPAFSRIFKELILIAHPDRPFPRAAKGTIQRKAAIRLYQEDMEALYLSVAQALEDGSFTAPASWSLEDIQAWLFDEAKGLTSGQITDIEQDLFLQGFDSLSATALRRRIIAALKSRSNDGKDHSAGSISLNVVYEHPSIPLLSHFLLNIVAGLTQLRSSQDQIEAVLAEQLQGLSSLQTPHSSTTQPSEHVVLVTGTTGSLGSYLLFELVKHAEVKTVYAINRADSLGRTLRERQEQGLSARGLSTDVLTSHKLVLLEGDAAQANLGLEESIFQELRSSVTTIIHNAWRVDFNLSLASFEPNIRGTRNLVDFALSSANASSLRFVFASSVGSAASWDPRHGAFPEEVQHDTSIAIGTGYGASKYISERVLASSGLQGTSVRIGQLAGSDPIGSWPVTDWVPILVRSSLALGHLPSSPGHVSWIPLNQAARSLLDVAFSTEPSEPAMNLLNPRPVPWDDVMQSLLTSLKAYGVSEADQISLVPFPDWVEQLRQVSKNANAVDLKRIPAVKLLPFFEAVVTAEDKMQGIEFEAGGHVRFALDKMYSRSQATKEMSPIDDKLVDSWIGYWKSQGVFAF